MNLTRSQRSIVAQFRSGTLPLRIETGRFTGLKIEERLCLICKDNISIETETHFLLECSHYTKERDIFLNETAIELMLSKDYMIKKLFNDYPRKLSKFLAKILDLRKDVEYMQVI